MSDEQITQSPLDNKASNMSNFLTLRMSMKIVYSALLSVASVAMPAHALEITAGDYEQLPSGTNLGLAYFQQASRDNLYVDGKKVASDFKLKSDILILRYVHVLKLNETTTFDANLIVPSGRLRTSGSAAPLGDTTSVGDAVVGGAFKFLLDPVSRDVFSIAPFLTVPTGSYQNDRALNVGDNRWSLLLQAVYIKHFNERWAIDLSADATTFGSNTSFGTANATKKTATRLEYQAHLRYNLSPATVLSTGLGRVTGAESSVDRVRQGDELGTTYGRLTVAHFINPTTQLQAQIGKDLTVRNGAKEDTRVNLRLLKLF